MYVFLCAGSCPLKKEEQEAQAYGSLAQLIETQSFLSCYLLCTFRIGNVSGSEATVALASVRNTRFC